MLPDSTPPWPSPPPPPPSPKKEIYGGLSGPFFFFWLPSDKNLLKKKKGLHEKRDFGGKINPRKIPIFVKSPYLDNRIYRRSPRNQQGSLNFLYSQIWLFPLVDDRQYGSITKLSKRPPMLRCVSSSIVRTPQGTQCVLGEPFGNLTRTCIMSVTCTSVALAQVLPRPQLTFPCKTWFFWNLLEFSTAEIT